MKPSACGLDCEACDLFLAGTDEAAAERLLPWFRSMGWVKPAEGAREIMNRGPYCLGCRGDMSVQWSDDCEIRICVNERKLDNCGHCTSFVCEKLQKWEDQAPTHGAAIEELRRNRQGH